MTPEPKLLDWLLDSDEPWTRYRTLVDLLDRPESDLDVAAARAAMLDHPNVQDLVAAAATWPGGPIKRHNDASHALHKLVVLAEMGLRADDPGMHDVMQATMAHLSEDSIPLSLLNIAPAFGGTGQDTWTWMMCDAPTLLYALLLIHDGLTGTPPVSRRSPLVEPPWAGDLLAGARSANFPPTLANAANRLASFACDNGWHCTGGPEVGKFRGPGKRSDPCPVANVLALKVLSRVPALYPAAGIRAGAEVLLAHWEHAQVTRGARAASGSEPPSIAPKPYLFGCGSDYRKLKYPFIWYDLLHVLEALSPYPFVYSDPRFQDMVAAAISQADEQGRFTAGAMYMPWKGWSFADKKRPSPWLTFLVLRIRARTASILPYGGQAMSGRLRSGA